MSEEERLLLIFALAALKPLELLVVSEKSDPLGIEGDTG